jgi:hypothetical protein
MVQEQTSLPNAIEPNGGAWAAVLAAGIGCVAFSAAVDLAERFSKFSDQLKVIYKTAGDLPGKSTIGVVVWIFAWVLLHLLLRNRTVGRVGRVTCVVFTTLLLLASLAAVFPPVMERISGK